MADNIMAALCTITAFGGLLLFSYFSGKVSGQIEMRDIAVDMKHAEYYIDENKNKKFRWKPLQE